VSTSATRHTVNPADGENLYEVPVATRDDLDQAVKHARAAFKPWSRTPWSKRGELLLEYAAAIEKHRDALEKLDVLESGKPASLAKVEYDMTLGWLRAFATMDLKDEVLEEDEDHVVYSTRPPLGVCAAIAPWNWPALLSLGKVGPALMTGNCIIVKPSPYTPYSSLKLGELAMSIFPPGVVQVLSGTVNLGPWITDHSDIDMVAFTGSIRTGKLVAASCAKTLKRYILELGGNDAAVVCEDVDPNDPACLPKITKLAFLNSGQICMDVKRIYVHEKIYDQFRDAMVEFTRKNIKTGDPFAKDTVVGPLQNKDQ
jgi:acyl-CoA reductase-like NAD-dependent aldehyde dehydrogenase